MLIGPPIRGREQRPERHHFAVRVADLEQLDFVGMVAELAAGLGDHLPGPAEAVEVVDVQRAEIDLQRGEHVGRD